MDNWYSTRDFCAVPLPRQWPTWCTLSSRKESTDSAQILIYRRGRRVLPSAVFLARTDNVFMEKRRSEDFRDGESLERYLCIWRGQNRYERADDRGNTVERYVDGFYGLERMRFHGLLSFQLDFQLESQCWRGKWEFWREMQGLFYQR